jgi:hypothetical protein
MKDSKDGKDRAAYFVEEGYLHNLQNYLRTGTYADSRFGANREKLIKLKCVKLAYDKNGMVKRTVGVFYPDIGEEWTQEMDKEYYGRREVSNKGKVYKARGKRGKRA